MAIKEKGKRSDRFGINMEQWCREHEAAIQRALEQGDDPARTLSWHEKKLAWLQHERLIHLIVLVMTLIGELFIIAAVLFAEVTFPYSLILMYLVLIVLIFYVRHYFILENTVQRWYILAEELHRRIDLE